MGTGRRYECTQVDSGLRKNWETQRTTQGIARADASLRKGDSCNTQRGVTPNAADKGLIQQQGSTQRAHPGGRIPTSRGTNLFFRIEFPALREECQLL